MSSTDSIPVVISYDIVKRPSITAVEILYIRDDASIAFIPAGTVIDVPETRNVNITMQRVGIASAQESE